MYDLEEKRTVEFMIWLRKIMRSERVLTKIRNAKDVTAKFLSDLQRKYEEDKFENERRWGE